MSAHRRRSWLRTPAGLAVACAVTVLGAGGAAAAAWPSNDLPGAVAAPAPDWRRVDLVNVVAVTDGRTLVTQGVDGTVVPVRVAGLTVPETGCGTREAADAARTRLEGETVTLVPDALGAVRDANGSRIAHVVLPSQLSYTDDAIREGVGRLDTTRAWTYAKGFAEEEGEARRDGKGLWPSCWVSER